MKDLKDSEDSNYPYWWWWWAMILGSILLEKCTDADSKTFMIFHGILTSGVVAQIYHTDGKEPKLRGYILAMIAGFVLGLVILPAFKLYDVLSGNKGSRDLMDYLFN
jgi:hypothetical protein